MPLREGDPGREAQPSTFSFGPFTLDRKARTLTRGGQSVPLTPKAFDLLVYLVERAGQVVTRAELLEALWPDAVVEEQNVNWNVGVLRKALGGEGDYIETSRGHGYRFVAPVIADAVRVEAPAAVEPLLSPTPAKPGSPRRTIALGAVLGLLFLGVVVYLLGRGAKPGGRNVALAQPRRSVAIVGFKNLSKRPEDEWLSTALSEMLGAELAAGGKIRLVPGDSVARSRAELMMAGTDALGPESPPRVAALLGSDMVVAGTYLALGEKPAAQLRFDVRLLDARTGEPAAVITESGGELELFGLVAEAGERLREAMGAGRLSAGDVARARATLPSNIEAAKLYAEGLGRLAQRVSAVDHRRELRRLEKLGQIKQVLAFPD